jgi:hypothetical protein
MIAGVQAGLILVSGEGAENGNLGFLMHLLYWSH